MQYSPSTPTTEFSFSPMTAIDASMRFLLGVMLCMCELFAYWVLSHAELNAFYYLRAILVASCVLALVMRFGRGGLLLDIKELCLYDLVAQITGLGLFCLGVGRFSLILVNAVLVLKIIRLFWLGGGTESARWPTFGLLGFCLRKKLAPTELPLRQRQLVWVVLLLSPIGGYLVSELDKIFLLAAWAAVPVLYLLLNARRLFSTLAQIPESLRVLAHERDQARLELQQLRQAQADAQSQEGQALVQAYFQVDPEMRVTLLPIVEAFSKQFPLDDKDSFGVGSGIGINPK